MSTPSLAIRPPRVLQMVETTGTEASPIALTLSGVKRGSTLVVTLGQPGSANRTWSTSDDQSNTWSDNQIASSSARQAYMAYAENAAAGDTVVTIAANASASTIVRVYEIEASSFVSWGTYIRNSDDTVHYCNDVGNDTPPHSGIIGVVQHNSSIGVPTAVEGQEIDLVVANTTTFQYQFAKTPKQSVKGEYTSTSRNCLGMQAVFAATGEQREGIGGEEFGWCPSW
ncbi:MAG: hypothetical protein V2I33_20390, partial [Kangiellaceae bacterium]|nr:hypothetical protein [Kangiellaceae bacterium]